MMTTRGKGCRLDRGKHPFTPFAIAQGRGFAISTAPAAVDIESFAPPVVDQTGYSACEGCSSSGAIATTLARSGTPLPWIPSQAGIYRLALALDRQDPSRPLADTGTTTESVIRAIGEFGIRPMGPAIGDTNCDLTDSVTLDPTLGELELDARTLALGAYRISSSGARKVNDVKLALASGFAVRVDTEVDQAFEDWTPKQAPYGLPNYAEGLGGHALYCVGYHNDVFTIRNSWGIGYGQRGNILVSASFIAQAEAYAWSVRVSQ